MKKYSVATRIAAGASALVLATSLVACSDSQKDAASNAASGAASAAKDAGADASAAAKSAGAEASAAVNSAMNGSSTETTDVMVAGQNVAVPAALASAISDNTTKLGEPTAVKEGANNTFLVTYPDGKYLAYNAQGEPVLVQGMIAETWIGQGGFESTVGAPVAEEKVIDNGWTQEFANGTIKWVDNGNGFGAEVTPKQ